MILLSNIFPTNFLSLLMIRPEPPICGSSGLFFVGVYSKTTREQSPLFKGSKVMKASKASKALKPPKVMKAIKASKATKTMKVAKAMKALKPFKASKATKAMFVFATTFYSSHIQTSWADQQATTASNQVASGEKGDPWGTERKR